jgi:hypothetical protein
MWMICVPIRVAGQAGAALGRCQDSRRPGLAASEAEPGRPPQFADKYPYLAEMAAEHILRPGYDFGDEFEVGLSVILDALTRSIPGDGSQPQS